MWAKYKQAGFTIVELLIVIVVIGILAAISIVAYNGIQNRARVAAQVSVLSQAAKNAAIGFTLNGSYPTAGALPTNSGISLTIAGNPVAESFCITATGTNYQTKNITQTNTISDGPCDGQSGGASYCPESTVATINGYYCNGTIGSVAAQNTGNVRLSFNAAEVPTGAPGESVGRQTARDNLIGATFSVVSGEVYCMSGWGTTTSSTVVHTVGLMLNGTSVGTIWPGVNNLSPVSAQNIWLKMSGCITIPVGYTNARFWTQNNGSNGTTADAPWYQTALTLTKN